MIMDAGKKHQTILVVNKLDINRKELDYGIAVADYYTLGFDKIVGISAKNENNISQLRDEIHAFSRVRAKNISPQQKTK